eukprot:CAMPEP_0184873428 /NCGR_PEP_ID=MMETSP0580-20130426/41838_1 /TAXON_ID=1118495 /ORGANISM="Dactyliosolen fragilissimus" /LENGTH=133 /DNA_ID=CAMNT_0027376333 /DNA_START=207 /DNA_END=608 /DNA_ORIENTATION=-
MKETEDSPRKGHDENSNSFDSDSSFPDRKNLSKSFENVVSLTSPICSKGFSSSPLSIFPDSSDTHEDAQLNEQDAASEKGKPLPLDSELLSYYSMESQLRLKFIHFLKQTSTISHPKKIELIRHILQFNLRLK